MAGKKLLVADDSLTIQKVIRLALSNEGYEIQAVSDGNDAIQQISLFRPDVVLIDVSLPGKSAFEVKRAINEHQDLEEVRFILMSSAFEKVDEPQVAEVRFHGRLTKPFDPAHLRQVLSEALSQVAAKRREPTSIIQKPETLDLEISSFEPVQPDEPIIAPPPPAEDINQLWDHEPTLTDLPPPLPQNASSPAAAAPAPPSAAEHLEASAHGSDRDADIRHLTESTIRMSGLDDFQWSVNEPSLKPPSQMHDSGGASFQIEPPGAGPGGTPPFKPEFVPEISNVSEAAPEVEMDALSLGGLPSPSFETQSAASPADFYRDPVAADAPKNVSRPPATASAPDVVPISSDHMEDLIRREIQKILPEIAEKIIKQEIHRMLSES